MTGTDQMREPYPEKERIMPDTVKFWLENKSHYGIREAEAGDQQLVLYDEKFYVVVNGAVQMKGRKPLYYTRSTIPAFWKKAMRGEVPMDNADAAPAGEVLQQTTATRKERTAKEKAAASIPAALIPPPSQQPVQAPPPKEAKQSRKVGKSRAKSTQASVDANCPYCNQRHEIPAEKGRSGKPFFMPCSKCKGEFAVRFVAVTVYQAQVAGFR